MSYSALGLPLQGKNTRWSHIELLELIDEYGSINKAASSMGMSYKAAWLAIDSINNMSKEAIVARQTGGSQGGEDALRARSAPSLEACSEYRGPSIGRKITAS